MVIVNKYTSLRSGRTTLRTWRRGTIALALTALVSGAASWGDVASAATITIGGPTKLSTAANNNALSGGVLTDGSASGTPWFTGDGAGVTVNAAGQYQVTWLYIGAESGFTNTFSTGGFTASENGGAPTGSFPISDLSSLPGSTFPNPSVVTYNGTAGSFIPFSFISPSDNTPQTNGDPDNDPSVDLVTTIYAYVELQLSQAGSIVGLFLTDTPTNYFLAAFDDSGAGPDDNHDDYIVLGYVQPVPIPAALPLFGAGVAAMGLLGWRRKRKAAIA